MNEDRLQEMEEHVSSSGQLKRQSQEELERSTKRDARAKAEAASERLAAAHRKRL